MKAGNYNMTCEQSWRNQAPSISMIHTKQIGLDSTEIGGSKS